MRHRHRLPQLDAARPFLTDGGLETTLIFHRGLDLPCFAAFDLLKDERGPRRAARLLRAPTSPSPATAAWASSSTPRPGAPTPTGRARLGYSLDDLDAANRAAVALAEEIRAAGAAEGTPIVINGVIGPRGDGYDPGELMSAGEAQAYHARQVATFAGGAVDMVTAVTMTHAGRGDRHRPRRPRARRSPPSISFTLETDGRLPDGQSLRAAIERVDAETRRVGRLLHDQLRAPVALRRRARAGRRPGASASAVCGPTRRPRATPSSTRPTSSTRATPWRSAPSTARCARYLGAVSVLGGCCGTDRRHVEAIGRAWMD